MGFLILISQLWAQSLPQGTMKGKELVCFDQNMNSVVSRRPLYEFSSIVNFGTSFAIQSIKINECTLLIEMDIAVRHDSLELSERKITTVTNNSCDVELKRKQTFLSGQNLNSQWVRFKLNNGFLYIHAAHIPLDPSWYSSSEGDCFVKYGGS